MLLLCGDARVSWTEVLLGLEDGLRRGDHLCRHLRCDVLVFLLLRHRGQSRLVLVADLDVLLAQVAGVHRRERVNWCYVALLAERRRLLRLVLLSVVRLVRRLLVLLLDDRRRIAVVVAQQGALLARFLDHHGWALSTSGRLA